MANNIGNPVLYRFDTANTYPAGSSASFDLTSFSSTLRLTDRTAATGIPAAGEATSARVGYLVCDMGNGGPWQDASITHSNIGNVQSVAIFLSVDGINFTKANFGTQSTNGTLVTAFPTGTQPVTRYLMLVFLTNGEVSPECYFEFGVTFLGVGSSYFDASPALFTAFVGASLCNPVKRGTGRKNAGDQMDMAQDHASGLITIIRSVGTP